MSHARARARAIQFAYADEFANLLQDVLAKVNVRNQRRHLSGPCAREPCQEPVDVDEYVVHLLRPDVLLCIFLKGLE